MRWSCLSRGRTFCLSFSEEQKGLEGEWSTALQDANEEEVMLLDLELNVLKGPSRDDHSK